jgi:hypothetical protein
MQELSPLRAESAKQIASGISPCVAAARVILGKYHGGRFTGQKLRLVLGFGAWHFQLSDGPILEEITYG